VCFHMLLVGQEILSAPQFSLDQENNHAVNGSSMDA
jgi:hypothetical protein